MLTKDTMEALEYLADKLAIKIVERQSLPEQWVDIKRVAEVFAVDTPTIYRWNRLGCPRAHTKPERYKISEVERWRAKKKW